LLDIGRPAEAERFARRSLDMIDGYTPLRADPAAHMLNEEMRATGVLVQEA
jgi:hypothetical protein